MPICSRCVKPSPVILIFFPARSSSKCINRWLLGDVQINLSLETNRPMVLEMLALLLKKKKKKSLNYMLSDLHVNQKKGGVLKLSSGILSLI